MFSTIIIHSGSNRAHTLRYLAASSDCTEVVRDLDHNPGEHELKRLVGALEPEVVLVDLGSTESLSCASNVRAVHPKAAVIGYGATLEVALMAPRVGFDAVLAENASPEDLRQAIHDALRMHQGGVEPNLFSYIPSKAGSGASTIVLNTAMALARDEGKRVLVIEADLRSGSLAIMLGAKPKASIQSVLKSIAQIDKRRFRDWVYTFQGVDFLLSSLALDADIPEWSDYFHLLSIVRQSYDKILVDMPELVNPASIELVRRSHRVFVVCTPEITSMKLASQRFEELTRLAIPDTRSGLIVNRWQKADPPIDEVSRSVDHEVTRVFPNDYAGVRSAILGGRPVSAQSRLGMAYTEFAGELCGKKTLQDDSLTGKLKSLWGIRETVRVE